jgi:hypothetical protein
MKRKDIEDKIFTTLNLLDPSGLNAKKYKDLFKGMSDKQFTDYFKQMKTDDTKNFYVEMDLYGKNNIDFDSIKASAKYLKLPLEEYVYIKHRTLDGKPIRSAFRVPVIYLHIKRMQQILSKKVITNTNVMGPGARSRITGSLSDKEKAGRLTDADTVALLSVAQIPENTDMTGRVGANSAIIQEILGARADNTTLKLQMQNEISTFGNSRMNTYERDAVPQSQAINTLDIFLIGAGLKSDIVTPTLMTKQGIKSK